MSSVNKLLDKAKEMSSSATDLALSEKLGIVPSAVCNYRNGRSKPDVVVCAKLAEITGENLLKVVAAVMEEREISRDAKRVWHRIAGMAASVVLIMSISYTPALSAYEGLTSHSLYIMSLAGACCFMAAAWHSVRFRDHA